MSSTPSVTSSGLAHHWPGKNRLDDKDKDGEEIERDQPVAEAPAGGRVAIIKGAQLLQQPAFVQRMRGRRGHGGHGSMWPENARKGKRAQGNIPLSTDMGRGTKKPAGVAGFIIGRMAADIQPALYATIFWLCSPSPSMPSETTSPAFR